MSELMEQAVLRMPPELWSDSPIDIQQRHERYVAAADELERLRARAERLERALWSIDVYGSDTLSGRVDGPDDREWQRESVREMRDRARAALAEQEPRK